MLDQVHGIIQAAEILVGTVGTPQERLAKGFTAFRQAAILSDDWPVDVWDKYNCICETLLAGGTWQRTIGRMDLKTASECATQISKAMKDLAVAVELSRSHVAILPPATTPLSVLDLSGNSERTRVTKCCQSTMTTPA
jgi:hypothetical protein